VATLKTNKQNQRDKNMRGSLKEWKNSSTSGISTFEFTNVLLAFASGSVSPRTLTNRKFNKTKFIKKKSSC